MITGLSDANASKISPISKSYTIGGKKLTLESGRLALLANGSSVIKDDHGNFLLTTVGIKEDANTSVDYFPLSVEFQEKYYAAGKIGGNRFAKREGKPSDNAILNSRLIDRPIRPMFPKGVMNDVQIISTILSSSGLSDFGFHGITAASLGLILAGCAEFEGPVSGVRIALSEEGAFIFDPTFEQLKTSKLDLTLAGTMDAITMVESQGSEVAEELMLKAFEFGHDLIKELCAAQLDFIKLYQTSYPIREIKLAIKEKNETLSEKINSYIDEEKIKMLYNLGKSEFHEKLHLLEEDVKSYLGYTEDNEEMTEGDIVDAVYGSVKKHMRKNVLQNKVRLDGRQLDEVRPVSAEFKLLPRVHGSALFQRGITQALSITTLGGPGDIQIIDDMFEEDTKRYIHHYNFPPFSVGEVRPLRGVGRREVGHGRLAEKALEPVLPSLEEFPYFIRVVSEITTCNGSSSMASVCGSSLSLMDAGVPIKNVVAGIAMGMVYDEDTDQYEVLSDIQAQEDFLGDLDFKVAATDKWITALQMDCKIKGLKLEVIRAVFAQAKKSLEYIRTTMTTELSAPRKELSPYAPSILSLTIPVDRIRELIGKGGETIQKITKDFSVEIDITDEGFVSITAKNQENGKAAHEFIKKMMRDIEVGDVATGKVSKIIEGTGAIIDLGQGKSGMIHISKLAKERVNNIEDYVKAGDMVNIRVITVDKEKGRIGLERIVENNP